ncbi:hypothetical protein G6F20_013876 [Rhizopus arrhizus]|nr:hypothetical protein G6F20_013876 [Rhizopus arrhizus]
MELVSPWLVQHPPSSRPPIDDLNASLNSIIYRSLDSSVGDRPPRPSHWKKYWTQQLQDAADFRNRCYRRWRRAFGIDKVYWWHQHQQANVSFRQAPSLKSNNSIDDINHHPHSLILMVRLRQWR